MPDTPALSRRSLIAATGFVTVGVTTGVASAATSPAPACGPIVVHVRDLASGTLDVYAGTTHRQIRDQDLAARLARSAG